MSMGPDAPPGQGCGIFERLDAAAEPGPGDPAQWSFRQAVVERAAEGICVCHEVEAFPHVRFTVWNPRMVELTGYTLEEINRLGWHQSLYPDPEVRARAVERMARMRTGEDIRGEEWTIVRRDGSPRVVSLSTSVVGEERGRIHVLAVMQDVTERRRAEERARREHAQTALANRILRAFAEHEGVEVFKRALTVVLEEMGSAHGVFGYVPEPGHLTCPSLTRLLDACEVEGKCIHYPPEKWKGLWARALREKRTLFANEPPPVPAGHPVIRNNLATPILFQGEVIGLLNIANKEGGYGEEDREFLDALAARIAPVLYAWIHRTLRDEEREAAAERLREGRDRFRLLTETAGRLLASDDPQAVVEDLCREVMEQLDCQAFFNFLVDPSRDRLRLNACAGVPEEEARAIEWLDYGVAVCGCAARDGERIVVEDIPNAADPRTDLVRSYGIRAYCCHPLVVAGRVIGTLSFGTKTRSRFTADEVEVMRTVADQVATAMERLQGQEALRRSEARLRALVEASSEVLYRMSPDGRQMRQLTGGGFLSDPPDPSGSWLEQYVPPEDQPAVLAAVREALENKEVFELEHRVLRADGSPGWALSRAVPLLDPRGEVVEWFGAASDITGRKRQEERLRQAREAAEEANRAKSEFLARMSHEIRTPMNGIMGMTELALLQGVSPKVREHLEVAKRSARSLLDIIDDVLDLSKIEARRVELTAEPFDLGSAVASALDPLEVLAREKGLELTCDLDTDLPAVLVGDEGRLRQVLVNLVGNAVKFTDAGRVEVEVSAAGNLEATDPSGAESSSPTVKICFAVRDTGIGISEEQFPGLFESFSGATRATHARYGGTGLGLAISREIVSLMGGDEIRVESAPGRGSTFSFTVELGIPAEGGRSGIRGSAAGEGAAGPRPAAAGGGLRVLVADDDATNRLFLRLLLEQLGHRPTVVSNGEEALRAWGAEGYDVVFMDVQMPVLDGIQATRRIRARERTSGRHTPIVALTAHALKGDRDRFLAEGMDEYLSKPFELQDLTEVMERSRRLGGGGASPG